jgi:tRNA/tmRNA/rRNA uracil-C5-methylase (TrmA/RlmC/RlmD family)
VGRGSFVHEVIADRRWRFSAGAFAQPGPEAADILVAAVRAACGQASGTVLDLYAGVGVLGAAVVAQAPSARNLIAVEGSAAAAADAALNLADVDGAVVVAGDVADALAAPRVVSSRPSVVIADPPRAGLGPAIADGIASLGAPVLVLVSCDPASLARDAGLLVRAGYRLEQVEVLDLFPGTFHVETVTRLVRTSSDAGTER